MARAADKAALLNAWFASRATALDHAMTALLLPFAHPLTAYSPAIRDRLHPLALAACATMHAGGDLQPGRTELMFGIEHFAPRAIFSAAAQTCLTVGQPRGIHHMHG